MVVCRHFSIDDNGPFTSSEGSEQAHTKGWKPCSILSNRKRGMMQDAEGKQNEKAERLRFGRFFYRFPNGESGADVYDRMTIFEDHMIRDINAGRFTDNTSLVLVTHGLALRVFLMRWFHWSVDQFLDVYNPPNAEVCLHEPSCNWLCTVTWQLRICFQWVLAMDLRSSSHEAEAKSSI